MTLKILKKEDDFKNNLFPNMTLIILEVYTFPNMTLIILIPRLNNFEGERQRQ